MTSGSWGSASLPGKRDYLGASDTISTRETTAARSTLQGERKWPVSLITTPRHWASTEGSREEGGGAGHLHARQEVQAGQ